MGLAASQARLLFITSRQNSVSANMQKISNQKLTLSRETEDVAQRYSRMLNATKITSAEGVDLSYNAFMGPEAAKNGSYKLLTNTSDGALVLSSTYANALGLTNATGTKDDFKNAYSNFDEFCKTMGAALGEGDAVAKAIATKQGKDTAATNAAYAVVDAQIATATKRKAAVDDWTNVQAPAFKSTYGEYPTNRMETSIADIVKKMGTLDVKGNGAQDWVSNRFNGVTALQILNGQACTSVEIACDGDRRGVPTQQAVMNLTAIANAFKNDLLAALGMNANSTVGKELTKYVNALSNATWSWNGKMNSELDGGAGGKLNEVAWTWATSTRGSADNDHMAMNAQNLLERMLYIALSASQDNFNPDWGSRGLHNAMDTQNNKFTITSNSKGVFLKKYNEEFDKKYSQVSGSNGNYSQMTKDEALRILKGETITVTIPERTIDHIPGAAYDWSELKSFNFIQSMWSNLSSNGWTTENNPEDMVSKLYYGYYNVDGNSLAQNDDTFQKIADEETRTQAEGYYEAEMSKINRKEKMLDMDMNKLQTEYDSLTSDVESVKAIIQKNVDRSFTFFQA